ncbi:hypothetical protein QFC24_005397 [Naganishia onofrii]|uniref:Uncharacterized protein n=1 Tax=Naganishia onofrii TaxID=1851511 RepID=A0ACC2X927_9TREE|nr:hypothetical protein QFC24_005397 [Naganishia onofrii]
MSQPISSLLGRTHQSAALHLYQPVSDSDSLANDISASDEAATQPRIPLPDDAETFRAVFNDEDDEEDPEAGTQPLLLDIMLNDNQGIFGTGQKEQDNVQEESEKEGDEETYNREWSSYRKPHVFLLEDDLVTPVPDRRDLNQSPGTLLKRRG